jgi:hypothetical protein
MRDRLRGERVYDSNERGIGTEPCLPFAVNCSKRGMDGVSPKAGHVETSCIFIAQHACDTTAVQDRTGCAERR